MKILKGCLKNFPGLNNIPRNNEKCHQYKLVKESFRFGGNRFKNVSENGTFRLPLTRQQRNLPGRKVQHANHSPYVEADLFRGTNNRGAKRVVYNGETGDVYVTGKHYDKAYYIGCIHGQKNKKCTSIQKIKNECKKPNFSCIVDEQLIIDNFQDFFKLPI